VGENLGGNYEGRQLTQGGVRRLEEKIAGGSRALINRKNKSGKVLGLRVADITGGKPSYFEGGGALAVIQSTKGKTTVKILFPRV